eukprot:c4604_g2_i1.p1 GENE.c4604_g2_i1~~c4604_g2_i1.p1  ORF type:complete len:164 (+),score=47.17 c4604_g2_i1:42-494(+)
MTQKTKETKETKEEGTATTKEAFGFSYFILSFICFGALLIWAYVPTESLNKLGLTYLPEKNWAIALPSFLIVFIVFLFILYTMLLMIWSEPLDSMHTIMDPGRREQVSYSLHELNQVSSLAQAPPIADISIHAINKLFYQNLKNKRKNYK